MESGPIIGTGLEITIIVISMIVSGLLVAAQRSINEVNKNQIKALVENEKNEKAKILYDLLDRHFGVLVVTMVVVSFCMFLNGSLLVINHGGSLHNFFASKGFICPAGLTIVLLSLIFTVIFCILVLFFPRQIARQHTQGCAMALARYTRNWMVIMKPLTAIMIMITNLLLKIFRQQSTAYAESYSEDEVISMLEIGQESGALKEEGKKMINSIFAFDDKLAYEIMTPRTDVFAIDILDEPDEFMDELMGMRYSRIPVYEEDSDNIIGILNIKDFLIKARENGFENVNIREILRKPFLIPETKNIDSLFFELQKTKQHIAILIDEYGGFSGIVTMEDIIEEVMGDIDDEYDVAEIEIEDLGNDRYLLDGNTSLDDINDEIHVNLQSESSETIGGFIIDILGEIPNDDPDESINVEYENYLFEVLNVKDRRIERVIMNIKPKEEKGNTED